MDVLVLSRIQFAANISFHILFPSITIGLAWFLVYFKTRFHRSNDDVWMRCYRFWVKLFALTFALGVVSGITMSFQFGTNWPGFMERVGNIAGPLLGYEVLTAFFMEATFLGIMLYGINRVPALLHTAATYFVAIGTTLSAFWIVALNSWMHTPAGFVLRDGVAWPVDWWAIVFNPSMPYRFVHVLLASALTAAFLIAGISAYRIRQGDPKPAPVLALRTALLVAAVVTPLQIFAGDLHGLNTFEHQAAKVAAMEGVWETQQRAPLLLFAWPDEDQRRNLGALGIPGGASWILTHDISGSIKGLNDFPGKHPPVAPVFWSFRIMVGVGFAMLACAAWGCWSLLRKPKTTTYTTTGASPLMPDTPIAGFSPTFLRVLVLMTFSGWLATLAGWYVTEIGRQPYLVTGVLTTAEAVTTTPATQVRISLFAYLTVYAFLLVAYVRTLFYMARKSAQLESDLYSAPASQPTPPTPPLAGGVQ